MNYVLFAFGDYTKEDQKINLIVDFVSQISTKEVKFQYGESGIIVSFATLSKSEDISDFFDDCLTKLTAMISNGMGARCCRFIKISSMA